MKLTNIEELSQKNLEPFPVDSSNGSLLLVLWCKVQKSYCWMNH